MRLQKSRFFQNIPLPVGVAVVRHMAHGQSYGLAVMAYIGGRAKGNTRRQVTKRFALENYEKLEDCIAEATKWREDAALTWFGHGHAIRV